MMISVGLKLINLLRIGSKIWRRSLTNLKIIFISDSSSELFDTSIRAEEEFLQMLKKLEIEAKERYLQALITSGVDKKVHIDYAVEKYDLCKAEVCGKYLQVKKFRMSFFSYFYVAIKENA